MSSKIGSLVSGAIVVGVTAKMFDYAHKSLPKKRKKKSKRGGY